MIIRCIPTSEESISVKDNNSYFFEYKDMKILHLGDCQANIIHIDSTDNKNYLQTNIPAECDVILMPIEGKLKFTPQVKMFIDMINPKIVIPMHYWSNDYKSEFFVYMNRENISSGKIYHIDTLNRTLFTYSKSENKDTIHIIDMFPNEYPPEK